MTTLRGLAVGVLAVSLIAVGVLLGCSSKETADDQTTTDQAATENMQEMDHSATGTAETVSEDLAAYDNPEVGIDPVCGMKVEPGYIEVATIGDKKYACCSASCAAKLMENPDKYLTASAEGHEGHDH